MGNKIEIYIDLEAEVPSYSPNLSQDDDTSLFFKPISVEQRSYLCTLLKYNVYIYQVSYLRYRWIIRFTYSDLLFLHKDDD